ncbi:MAG: ArsR/SmtB family transcription factor [Phycisphaerales bacterium]
MRNQQGELDHFTSLTHAVSDPNRVRLLAACLDTERCVCQLVELIDLSNPSISKHLSVLRAAGLLESRREGRWVHYRTPESSDQMIHDVIRMIRSHVLGDPVLMDDRVKLLQIDSIDPCDLARMQREGCCPATTEPNTQSETKITAKTHN